MVAEQTHSGRLEALSVLPDVLASLRAAKVKQTLQRKFGRGGDANASARLDINLNGVDLLAVGVKKVLQQIPRDHRLVPIHTPRGRDIALDRSA